MCLGDRKENQFFHFDRRIPPDAVSFWTEAPGAPASWAICQSARENNSAMRSHFLHVLRELVPNCAASASFARFEATYFAVRRCNELVDVYLTFIV